MSQKIDLYCRTCGASMVLDCVNVGDTVDDTPPVLDLILKCSDDECSEPKRNAFINLEEFGPVA